ncbi:NmrA family transcriptional regulator [Lentzea sp. NBRC 105346]|uniref:SDR family oxidoreductase n=1 Tax=Lentzea sp. NBRC 105346 TaxID=3032205 RepID=UPI0024A4E85D|nr:NAD(P)H-binding protein [Lentzea sp. NBRC 105346]GLZ32880.1 NmrA family transcriptional regulator [Lentzea sp. NBRC 105346]
MIVVTGATGNVGRPLVELLGDKAVGVSRPQVDLAKPETLDPVLKGADAVFLLFAGDLLGPDTDIDAVLDVVKRNGVPRVVLLSSQGAGTRPDMVPHSRLAGFEEAVKESPEWTILQPSGFFSNAYAWVQPIKEHGIAPAPFADVAIPFVDPADIAAVAAKVLTEDGHNKRTYVLTGPEATTPRQRAEALGARFVEQTAEEAREQMLRFMPPPVVDGTLTILGAPTPEEQQVSAHVEQILGRKATTFEQWAARNAPAFK